MKLINKFEEIYNNVNDALYTISNEGKILSLNNAFEILTGWKTTNWINMPFSDIIHPDDLTPTYTILLKILAGEKCEPHVVRIKTKSGSYIVSEVNNTALKIDNKIIGVIGIGRDISYRIKQEEQLKEIYQSVSVKTGTNYFSNLTKYICENLDVKYAMIGVYSKENNCIDTLSFRKNKTEVTNFNFTVNGSFCEKIIKYEKFIFNKDVRTCFPNDKILNKYKINYFIGYPLINEDNEVLGVITLMSDKPIENIIDKELIISFILDRTANEIIRTMAQNKLYESEKFSQNIFSALSSQVAVINSNGDLLNVNDSWKNFGIHNGSAFLNKTGVGSNYFDVCENAILQGDIIAKKTLKGLKSILKGKKQNFQIEYPCHSPKEDRWFILVANLIAGKEKKVVIKHINITERKLIERKLKISELNYRTMIDNSQDFMFSCDINGNFTFSNKIFKDALKYTDTEIENLNLFDIVFIESQEDCKESFLEILKGKSLKTKECTFITKAGEKIYVEGNGAPLIIDGIVIGIHGFFKNVTERKIAEVRLIKSKLRYKNLVENINDAIIIKNINGEIEYANQRFFDLLGYEESDLIGFKSDKYVYEIWLRHIEKYYIDLLNNKLIPNYFEYLAKHANGKIRWLEDKPTLLYEGLKISGIQIVIRDITEIKQKETEFKKLIEDLTNKNNEMMQFNYIVSHNLRSPIANIIGLSNLLENKKITAVDKDKILIHIKESSLKMDEILKDLSLVLNTKTNLNAKSERVHIHNIFYSISETLEKQIQESNCKIITDIAPNANEIVTIKSYLESIFYNLLSNAIKYRAIGRQLIIKLTTRREDNKILIEIEDNGIGIDLNEHGAYIFGLYKRFNFDAEGKGLGLHMTKNQVVALGGKIFIESEPDKGTIFKIKI